jgi:hypothetical protein
LANHTITVVLTLAISTAQFAEISLPHCEKGEKILKRDRIGNAAQQACTSIASLSFQTITGLLLLTAEDLPNVWRITYAQQL